MCLCVSDLTTSCLHRSCCSAAAQPRLNPTKRQYCRVDDFIRNNKRKHTRHTRLQQCCTNHTTRVCFSHCHKFQISENISSCLQKNLHPYSIYINLIKVSWSLPVIVEVLAAKAKQSWWMDCELTSPASLQEPQNKLKSFIHTPNTVVKKRLYLKNKRKSDLYDRLSALFCKRLDCHANRTLKNLLLHVQQGCLSLNIIVALTAEK